MSHLNRRAFLQHLTAATGMGLLGLSTACASDPSGRKRAFRMSLNVGAIGVSVDQLTAIRFARSHGFEAVTPQVDFLAALTDDERASMLDDMKAGSLTWGSAGLPVDFRGDEAVFQDGLQQLPDRALGLQKAGVTRINTWLTPAHDTLTYLANFEQHTARLGAVARVLGDHGLRFGLEYVGPRTSRIGKRYPFIHTMAETRELIEAIGHPAVGLVLDSWHWFTAEESKEDLLSLTNEDIVACDLNDAPPGLAIEEQMDLSRELPMATGVIDTTAFLNALVQIGYDGPVRAEPFNAPLNNLPDEEAVAATAAAMKKAFALVS